MNAFHVHSIENRLQWDKFIAIIYDCKNELFKRSYLTSILCKDHKCVNIYYLNAYTAHC